MRKIIPVLVLAVFLGGCATYKFQHGEKPYDKGYVVSRGGHTLLEYTAGSGNSVPQDLEVAKSRFKRRRRRVERYYKQMGEIQNRFKATFVDPVVMGFKFLGGMLKLPCVAVSDYRYGHNSKYRKKIDRMEREQDEKEAMRTALLKEQLDDYIRKDLASEGPPAAEGGQAKAAGPVAEERDISIGSDTAENPPVETPAENPIAAPETRIAPLQEAGPVLEETAKTPSETQTEAAAVAAPVKGKSKERPKVVSEPMAVIIAKPIKGCSPLTVRFYGSKSYSKKARIVSYQWDFGDGDTSNKPNPVNTYYSGSYYPRHFAVTLTVTDSQGYSDTAHLLIEVINK
ncbi:MAG: PKD domain-containing protein [Candidatus Omnitrophota bacterium]